MAFRSIHIPVEQLNTIREKKKLLSENARDFHFHGSFIQRSCKVYYSIIKTNSFPSKNIGQWVNSNLYLSPRRKACLQEGLKNKLKIE